MTETTKPQAAEFIERLCEVGGCFCSAWNTWYWEMFNRVVDLPDAPQQIYCQTDDDHLEAVGDYAEVLCALGIEPKVRIALRRCARPGSCGWRKRAGNAEVEAA